MKAFLNEPLAKGNLEALCSALVVYEADARFNGTVAAEKMTRERRAEVKTKGECRDCGCKLTEANTGSGSGYQCRTCKTAYNRKAQAIRRADLKAAPST